MTAAFTSSNISYDWETDKKARRQIPDFYGFVPDNAKGKLKVFLSLSFLSAFKLLSSALTCVLLQVRGGMALVAQFLGGELPLFYVVKALRRDLWYWFPLYSYSGRVRSALIRLIGRSSAIGRPLSSCSTQIR
jgi:hypothetical protein